MRVFSPDSSPPPLLRYSAFYDGIFGPGAGSFYMIGARFANFGSNFGSLLIYSTSGHILLPAGLAMGAGAFLGAGLGARSALREGARLVRPLIVVVCCAMGLKLMTAPGGLLSSEWKYLTGG